MKIRILTIAITALIPLLSTWSANSNLSYRDQFSMARASAPFELLYTRWNCQTHFLFNGLVSSNKDLFYFQPVLHNNRMLYSWMGGSTPKWFPAWYYGWGKTMQTAVPFKTNDFLQSRADCDSLFSCLDFGEERENNLYLKLQDMNSLHIEWTTTDKELVGEEKHLPEALSHPDEMAFAYSLCRPSSLGF